ncbi:hypothetical protein [Streptomyces sp. S.PB5]|uniref:hypothetical protein n=1 Tax=Streptomyces sp. S.PB5 TaxID=3020844 RepID=UPI0025B0026E|nr:hypothetical protein [Streptomyces sp. S.PB5]MDN3024532.1 hypothetical protein [Streptomyces sp. S.PB5]
MTTDVLSGPRERAEAVDAGRDERRALVVADSRPPIVRVMPLWARPQEVDG